MKLLIVGSTGSIGVHLVTQALEQGHTVMAFARTPAKLDSIKHPNLRVVQGDVLNLGSLVKAVAGQDAVLCSLGAGREGHVRSEGTRNVIRAMEQTGVKRFICQTTLGAGDSRNTLNFFWKYLMFGLLLKKAYQDHELQERFIQQSHLDWTITRPAAFVDGNRTGQYKHGFFESGTGLTLKISRADVADFMLKQLTNRTYLRKAPGQSY